MKVHGEVGEGPWGHGVMVAQMQGDMGTWGHVATGAQIHGDMGEGLQGWRCSTMGTWVKVLGEVGDGPWGHVAVGAWRRGCMGTSWGHG